MNAVKTLNGESRQDLWKNTQSSVNFLLRKVILIKTNFFTRPRRIFDVSFYCGLTPAGR